MHKHTKTAKCERSSKESVIMSVGSNLLQKYMIAGTPSCQQLIFVSFTTQNVGVLFSSWHTIFFACSLSRLFKAISQIMHHLLIENTKYIIPISSSLTTRSQMPNTSSQIPNTLWYWFALFVARQFFSPNFCTFWHKISRPHNGVVLQQITNIIIQ